MDIFNKSIFIAKGNWDFYLVPSFFFIFFSLISLSFYFIWNYNLGKYEQVKKSDLL